MQPRKESLPPHDEVGWLTRVLEVACLVAATGLLLAHVLRFMTAFDSFAWWLPIAVVAAMLSADFASGIVHWTADTWGSETMPVLGRRFLRPFRVHHVNPEDFLRRNFIDTNGDVAMLNIPILLSVFLIPLDSELGRLAAVFAVAFSASMLPTNQVHQWAHMSNPPAWAAWLQRRGLLLSREQHQMHHTAPYATNYCITTGWCNRTLAALGFFPAMEAIIFRITGVRPRDEDEEFAARTLGSAGILAHSAATEIGPGKMEQS